MISPEYFLRNHKRHATDVIRVALDRKGVIGFIEIHETMNLMEARASIWENVENAPNEFQFILEDGAPVSARQENTQKISSFYPCIKIRECRKTKPTTASEKICVCTASGEEFSVWVSEDYTFGQLRRDSSRYWNLPTTEVALTDEDGCLWPEQAKIRSVMNLEEISQKKIFLEYRGSTTGHRNRKITWTPATKRTSFRRATSSSIVMNGFSGGNSANNGRGTSSSNIDTSQAITNAGTSGSGSMTTALTTASAEQSEMIQDPAEELWRVFTFYCVHGDSLELEYLKAHQFNRLLRDCRLFSGNLTPAMVDIIYTSETKGKLHPSGKMNYDEFLNALVKIASKTQSPYARPTYGLKQLIKRGNTSNANGTEEEEELLFQKLVLENILPHASRWSWKAWDEHTKLLRQQEVVAFVSKFLEPLLDIFMFYAKNQFLNPHGSVKELYMSYADYYRFVNDFGFTSLQLSSVECSQIFLASCQSVPFHAEMFGSIDAIPSSPSKKKDSVIEISDNSNTSGGALADTNGPTNASSANGSSGVLASIQRILESVEGSVAYAFDQENGRTRMGFSAFLDMIGRIGVVAFSKVKSIKPLHAVKAMFHHISRGLTRARVLEILQSHGSSALHASKFYSGTVAFTNRFLDMWRYEGSPDYLTGAMIQLANYSKEKLGLQNVGASVNSSNSCLAISSSPGKTSPRTRKNAHAMLEERTNDMLLQGSAGRGREVLGRLVRASYVPGAATASGNLPGSQHANKTGTPNGSRTQTSVQLDAVVSVNGHVLPSSVSSPGISIGKLSINTFMTEQNRQYQDFSMSDGEYPGNMHESVVREEGEPDDLTMNWPISRKDATNFESISSAASPPSPSSDESISMPPATPSSIGPHHVQPQLSLTGLSSAVLLRTVEDEKALYERILLKGGVFKKYGQWGNPHRRYVWCSKEFDMVNWRPLNKKNSNSKEGIPVSTIRSILPGNSSRTKYAFMKHLSDEKSISRCFSVVAEDRRLDLEADSEATRDLWMSAFSFLMTAYAHRWTSN